MKLSNKDIFLARWESTMTEFMRTIGATPEMEAAIIDRVKAMVESAYMDGRIDKHIEMNEELNK